MGDEGFIHPAKSSKNLSTKTKNPPIIDTYNKIETLSNMSHDWAEMNNEPIKIQELKPQPIFFIKMSKNFIKTIPNIENSLNSTL